MRPRSSADVERFLPLTPVAFEILIALAAGDQHGYSIMQEVERRSEGRIVLHPGTLYRALGRLEQMGLMTSAWEDPQIPADANRPRRRLYALTPDGQTAVANATRESVTAPLATARISTT